MKLTIGTSRLNRLRSSRPGFIEGGVPAVGGGGGRLVRRSTFPVKDDAGYIGYLTDDEDDMVSGDGGSGCGGGCGGGCGSGCGSGSICSTVARRRRELLASESDVSFSNCMMMIIMICGLLLLFLFAVSSWGVPPPRRRL